MVKILIITWSLNLNFTQIINIIISMCLFIKHKQAQLVRVKINNES